MKWVKGWLTGICLGVYAAGVQADAAYNIKPVTDTRFTKPWTAQQLPDGRWVVTERKGFLVVINTDGSTQREPVALPGLYFKGQGGLLDFALTQDFSLSHRVLISYAQGDDEHNRLVVVSAKFDDGKLSDIQEIFRVTPDKATPVHFAGRLAVLDDGTWLLSSGDGFDYREQAQVKSSQLGKILRFREDGSAPQDNPFADAPYVYSLGHRNPQGLIVDPQTNIVYQHEHGPAGGDEINLIEPGHNYGWPVITNGLDYSGARITPFTEYPGMQQPALDWTPSVAPSGMALYHGKRFASLDNHLLVTTLKAQQLLAVNLSQSPIRSERIFATIEQRLRDVAVGADEAIYVLTDGYDAQLLRITPVSE